MQPNATVVWFDSVPTGVDWLTPWLTGALPGVVGWLVVTIVSGAATIGVLGRERVEHLLSETVRRPDVPFAVGFVVAFVPFTFASVLFVGTDAVPAGVAGVLTAGSAVGFLFGVGLLAIGAGVGSVAVGGAVDPTETPAAWRSLFVGVAVLTPLQFVPVAGTALGVLATIVGTGVVFVVWYQRSNRSVAAVDRLLWSSDSAAPASPVFGLPFDPDGHRRAESAEGTHGATEADTGATHLESDTTTALSDDDQRQQGEEPPRAEDQTAR